MARVTVEDCIIKIPNRFELVAYAAQRARQISAGAQLTVERDNDKNPVIALREIAEGHIDTDSLKTGVLSRFRRHVEMEPQEEEFTELFTQETLSHFSHQTDDLYGTQSEGEDDLEEKDESFPSEEE